MSLDTSVPESAPAASGRIIARYPLLKGMEVPAQAYAGIESPLPTVGPVNLIPARSPLDGARAEAFVTAMQQAGPASQWCRTKDTAELAFPNRARQDANFNSFFGDSASQPAQTSAALNTLKRWKGPGALVVVTHLVNITALTGVAPASSEGVVVRSKTDGIEVVGHVPP